jgi:AcrR family transcriptional regulator
MAYYTKAHVRGLKAIRRARDRGMPLFAIRDGLGKEDEPSRYPGAPKKTGAKSAHGASTRESLLSEGCRLFCLKGYANTKVSDITKRLKVGKGTFYFYFMDKKELFLECAPRIFAQLFSEGWEHIGREKDPLKRLELRGRTVFPVLSEFCAILSLAKEAMADPDRKIARLGRSIFRSILDPIRADIAKGVLRKVFRPVDPELYSAMILGAMEGLHHLLANNREIRAKEIETGIYEFVAFGLTQNAG